MTTVADGYNGWSNKATWNVQLWITNKESIYKLVQMLARGSSGVGEFADTLEAFLWILWEGKTPDGERLNPVNWVEIAEAWGEDNDYNWL